MKAATGILLLALLISISPADASSLVVRLPVSPQQDALRGYTECVNSALRREADFAGARRACSTERDELTARLKVAETERFLLDLDARLAQPQDPEPDSLSTKPPPPLEAAPRHLLEIAHSTPRGPANEALRAYFDCVTRHPQYANRLDLAVEGCLTQRSAVAAQLPADAAERLLAQTDEVLGRHWMRRLDGRAP